MFHYLPTIRFCRLFVAMQLLVCAAICLQPGQVRAADENQIVSLVADANGDRIDVRIRGLRPLHSNVYELPQPSRIIVDVTEARLAKNFAKMLNVPELTVNVSEVADAKPEITRFELLLPGPRPYTSSQEGNDVLLTIQPAGGAAGTAATGVAPQAREDKAVAGEPASKDDQVTDLISQKKTIEQQLPKIKPLRSVPARNTKEQQMHDAFNFSGYSNERITVEFQKMDLHNVFNFLRQVSGVNIVVDESVVGSLTLVLDDVPWDFALDVILNLKDLRKEERFNTIVIYPKEKSFNWPKQAQNNLSFQANSTVLEQDSLIIQQKERRSNEDIEVQNLLVKAREAEQASKFDAAVRLYEQILAKNPANLQVANKIASIYLVQLGQNAKSLQFSQRVLEKDPRNSIALLNGAVATANMQNVAQAETYFRACTSEARPAAEALLSFAAFRESRKQYTEALALLARHDEFYGATLDSMVASARLYDKTGNRAQATKRYQSILSSDLRIPPDLERYIKSRVALKKSDV
ncbi:MAG: hypothetical protein ACOX5Z_05375 [Desulfobulbus sp.]|jgi:type IV pilus assembly protein PilQ